MLIYARHSRIAELHPAADALLLEGDWPDAQLAAGRRYSLDRELDARHKWIDDTAHSLAERCATSPNWNFALAGARNEELQAGHVFALKLRYEFVKWLRVIAFFERDDAPREVRLYQEADNRSAEHQHTAADTDYEILLRAISCRHGFELRSVKIAQASRGQETPGESADALQPAVESAIWRARLEQLCRTMTPPSDRTNGGAMLLGNPRILDPICAEFLRRRVPTLYLRNQFAPRSWLKWRYRGGEQIVIPQLGEPHEQAEMRPSENQADETLFSVSGVDLRPCVDAFLSRLVTRQGAALLHQRKHIETAINRHRPRCLVVDEDATPRKRVAIEVARAHGVPSFVIQHGAPRVRFGFAPAAADVILTWGQLSQQRMCEFGITADRVAITGRADLCLSKSNQSATQPQSKAKTSPRSLRALLLATTPPRDDRPEPVEFHLTTRAHEELLTSVFTALSAFPAAQLTIKRHPRCSNEELFQELSREFPKVAVKLLRRGNVLNLAQRADVVLNLASGAGIEAAAAGAKVIELIPSGGCELLPAIAWGAIGAATTAEQLSELLNQVLLQQDNGWLAVERSEPPAEAPTAARQSPTSQQNAGLLSQASVFFATGRDAARRAVNEITARLQPLLDQKSLKDSSASQPRRAQEAA